MPRVADVLIEMLVAAGVKRGYGIVGDSLNTIMDAMHKEGSIEWVHTRHEETAAFAAGADADLSGQLGFCAGSSGPGSLHLLNGLYESHRNRAPVIALVTHIPSTEIGSNFPQETDAINLFRDCSFFCEQIFNPQQAVRMFRMAIQTAVNRRGVSVLIIPGDIAKQKCAVDIKPDRVVHKSEVSVLPESDQLVALAKMLDNSKRVAIYAGLGAANARDEVITLAAKLQAPIVHTTRAKDFYAYDNPYDIGMTGLLGMRSGYEAIHNCTTLLMLGTDFAYPQFYPPGIKMLQVDTNAANIGKRHPVDFGVIGDVKSVARALTNMLAQKEDNKFLEKYLADYKKSLAKIAAEAEFGKDDKIIHPQSVASLVNKYADKHALFLGDAGESTVWSLRYLDTNPERRALITLLHGTMGSAMPQAIGIKKAFPDRQVVALCSDGSFSMLMGDLLTLVQEELDIKIVLFNNSSLGFVEMEQRAEGLVDRYTKLVNPDFGKVAEAVGIKGQRITLQSELEEGIQWVLSQEGPALLDVTTNTAELVMPSHTTLDNVAKFGLYTSKAMLDGRMLDVYDMLKTNINKFRP